MQIQVQSFTLNKRFPLTISQGTTAQSTNIWLTLNHDGIEGWGEASPIGIHPQESEAIALKLQHIAPKLEQFSPFDRQRIEQVIAADYLPSTAQAALDLALHDWLGKRLGCPLWQLWGLDRDRIAPTSVTIGINSPNAAQQQVQDWFQRISARAIKVKLGNPIGIAADQAMVTAVLNTVPQDTKLSVDANGGWSLEDAYRMADWLAEHKIAYIEQPLPRGQEADLRPLYQESPLPIFVDESCFTSQDILPLADRVHGINIKLMKSGGLAEALRMIHLAKACGLQIMLGCYSDSALANTAAAHLAAFADHLDLDSHLNLIDNPFSGAVLQNGCLLPNELPGLGVTHHSQFHLC